MLNKRLRFSLAFKRFPLLDFIPPVLLGYCLLAFLLSLADALMSYTTPVFLENKLGNPAQMGILLGISPIAGILFDVFLEKNLANKSYLFFLKLTFLSAVCFPLIFILLPPSIIFLILAVLVWGTWYELTQFTNFRFIHVSATVPQHAASWGILSIFRSTAYLLGPLFASLLISYSFNSSFYAVLGVLGIAFLLFLLFLKNQKNPARLETDQPGDKKITLACQFKVLRSLLKKIWPLWLFTFAILFIDATFWSVGTVLSEELKTRHPLGGFLLVAYMLPSLFIGLLAKRVSRPLGKKRAAFIAGLLAGLILAFSGLVKEPLLLLSLVFFSSIFSSLSVPEILAVYEDYVARLGRAGDEMVALERSSENLAYILGPMIAGAVALLIGSQKTFTVSGLFLAIVSLLALIIVPKKIRLPQKEILNNLNVS